MTILSQILCRTIRGSHQCLASPSSISVSPNECPARVTVRSLRPYLSSSRKPEGKGEIAGIQQRQRTDFRSVAFDPLRLAARRGELRGVDIRDADFLALEPEPIAVDDAVHISVGAAQ